MNWRYDARRHGIERDRVVGTVRQRGGCLYGANNDGRVLRVVKRRTALYFVQSVQTAVCHGQKASNVAHSGSNLVGVLSRDGRRVLHVDVNFHTVLISCVYGHVLAELGAQATHDLLQKSLYLRWCVRSLIENFL